MSDALKKINTRVKQLKKKHPKSSHVELQRKASAQLKREGRIGGIRKKKAATKKAVPARKVKVKIKPGKKGSSSITIGKARKKRKVALVKTGPSSYRVTMGGAKESNQAWLMSKKAGIRLKHGYDAEKRMRLSGIHVSKVSSELKHKQGLETAQQKHKALLKTKGLSLSEKNNIRRDIKSYGNAIKESKRHIAALKRGI